MVLKRSPFLHMLSLDEEHVAFYNSLTLDVAFLKKAFVKRCEKKNGFIPYDEKSAAALHSLEQLQLLIKKESDGFETFNDYKKALEEPSINILYLLLTDACNLRCKYCYILDNMKDGYAFSCMPEETALRAIDMFARCIQKSIAKGYKDQQIVIYGGEPTINKKTLLTVLNYIKTAKEGGFLPQYIGVTLNTNGSLLDIEILEQAKQCNAVVAISIDGPPEMHDQLRVYPDGKPSHVDVLKGYELAKSLGVKTGVCCTVDEHNLGKLPWVINWLSTDLGVRGMGFNILIGNKENHNEDENKQYAEMVAKELIDCFLIAREKGVYEDRIMRRVRNFIEKTPVFSDCGGCGLQMVISPDRKIGVCQAYCGTKEYFVSAPFETFEPEKHPHWKLWRKRSPFLIEKCKTCIALGNCGGGCPYNAEKKHGSLLAVDERFCAHAKAAVEFLIRDLWKG